VLLLFFLHFHLFVRLLLYQGTPETTTEKIPYETKREFDPKLAPGTEEVVQKGENGEKTTTTPIYVYQALILDQIHVLFHTESFLLSFLVYLLEL
jgi:hypothetical protein